MFQKNVDEQEAEDWDRMMAINLEGPFLMAKHCAPEMRKRGGGAIVNVESIEGYVANPLHTAYAAPKAGVHGLTLALAVNLGPEKIQRNSVCPGWVDIRLNREYMNALRRGA